jgi:hypothetical protein
MLEALVSTTTWPVYSPFAKEHYGRGKAEGEAEAILLVLRARGLAVTEEQRARITACADVEQLKDWVTRAVSVESASDLFR